MRRERIAERLAEAALPKRLGGRPWRSAWRRCLGDFLLVRFDQPCQFFWMVMSPVLSERDRRIWWLQATAAEDIEGWPRENAKTGYRRVVRCE